MTSTFIAYTSCSVRKEAAFYGVRGENSPRTGSGGPGFDRLFDARCHGNQRGRAKDLARHLLKAENEHVEVHELRGFVSDNLVTALNEVYAISRGTRAKQFLFSLSLNPPPEANVPTAVFEDAIARIETKLGRDSLSHDRAQYEAIRNDARETAAFSPPRVRPRPAPGPAPQR